MQGDSFMPVNESTLRRGALAVLLVGIVQTAGCCGPWRTPPQTDATKSASATAEAALSVPAETVTRQEPALSPDNRVSRVMSEAIAPGKKQEPVTKAAPGNLVSKSDLAAGKPVAPHPVAPKPAPLPKATTEQAKVHVDEQKTPALDLDSLEKRLRETSAVGVFTKLSLKNQVDDLLDKFRDFYQGRSTATLQQLRQNYDMLITKVLALLQDGDPPLARDILESREAIWKVLADPKQFASS